MEQIMEKYLDKEMTEVAAENPELAKVLEKYDIVCKTCDGKCKVKHVIEEHNLSMKQEMALRKKMSEFLSE